MPHYFIKKVGHFNLLSIYRVSQILVSCGKDMAQKFNLHHWNNSIFKTFLIVCYLSLKNDIWLVIDERRQSVATFQTKKTSQGLHFGKLATSPQSAGKGIGSFCMLTIEKIAIELDCNVVYMEVYDKSQHAIDFYLHRGYIQCGVVNSLKYKEYVLQKQLNQ